VRAEKRWRQSGYLLKEIKKEGKEESSRYESLIQMDRHCILA
jgi:hypothetical protein